jgi:hypothetical protein
VGVEMETAGERTGRLRFLENAIFKDLASRHRAGLQLRKIRDEELFRESGYTCFEQFCIKEFDFTQIEVNVLIGEATRTKNILNAMPK